MPTQTHNGTNGARTNAPSNGHTSEFNILDKPTLPNKLPPPPPPPPKALRPPTVAPPPPPPPPRVSSQFSSQSNLSGAGQLCIGTGSNGSNSGISTNNLTSFNNNPSTISSMNSPSSRFGLFQPTNHNRSAFSRHGECGSRSSISSHNSSLHHHHNHHTHNNATSSLNHQSMLGHSSCQSNYQHAHQELVHDKANQNSSHTSFCNHSLATSNKCTGSQTGLNLRIPHITSNGSATMPSSHTTISRHDLFRNGSPEGSTTMSESSKPFCCGTNASERSACNSTLPANNVHHHAHQHSFHHHPNLHTVQLSSGSSISSPQQTLDPTSITSCGGIQALQDRCNSMGMTQSNTSSTMQLNNMSPSLSQIDHSINKSIISGPHACPLEQRSLDCCDHHHHHHHHSHHHNMYNHSHDTHEHGQDCSHRSESTTCTHSCSQSCVHTTNFNRNMVLHTHSCSNNNLIHHSEGGQPHHRPNRCLEGSPHELGTGFHSATQHAIHAHNLSNSSTTTHTSNVAVRHQPIIQYHHHQQPQHRPAISRGARSSSSTQHYDSQYGPSSAASTSSATASLSNYRHTSLTAQDDLMPLYLQQHHNNGAHQPLPPAPPPVPALPPPPPPHLPNLANKHQPTNLSGHQILALNNNENISNNAANNNLHAAALNLNHNKVLQSLSQNQSMSQTQQQQTTSFPLPPPPLPPTLSTQTITHTLPPLPPKPVSPSSCSTQITTVRASSPVTRVTSQAGVQMPLPSSDIPPPLPPNNPGSRNAQPLIQSLIAKHNITEGSLRGATISPLINSMETTSFASQRSTVVINPETKIEQISRQIELEQQQQHQKLADSLGNCPKCNMKVLPTQEACKAMNQIYHANCFVCCTCNRTLLGKTFYPVGDRVYCEEDFNFTGHMSTLEKCAACSQPIFNMILRLPKGKSYHPKCFKCCVCGQCLDGIPFTIDRKNKIYCVKDYHNSIYTPKCAACGKTILPIDGTDETVRVVSMNKDYHVDCYCCEDCGLQLTDEEPSRSYPLDNHLLCQPCHINRLSQMQAALNLG